MTASTSTKQAAEPQKTDKTSATASKTTPNPSATTAPRKRRRRAPATGATEDCFSCKKRQVKCDRRRPYCGQCVEIGKECTGYRTTLTWGVGVASRGKLRGMSLPIATSPSAVAKREQKPRKSSVVSNNSAMSTLEHQQCFPSFSTRGSIDVTVASPTSPMSPPMYSAPRNYPCYSQSSPIPIPVPSTTLAYAASPPSRQQQQQLHQQHHHHHHYHQEPNHFDHFQTHVFEESRSHVHRGPLHRLRTSLHLPYEESGLSASSASLGTNSDSDLLSPTEFPPTPVDDHSFADSLTSRFPSVGSHEQAAFGSLEAFFLHNTSRPLAIADDVSSSVGSDQSIQDYVDKVSVQQFMGPPAFPDIFTEGVISSSFDGFQPGLSYPHPADFCHNFLAFPTETLPAGLVRRLYIPGPGGF